MRLTKRTLSGHECRGCNLTRHSATHSMRHTDRIKRSGMIVDPVLQISMAFMAGDDGPADAQVSGPYRAEDMVFPD